MGAGGPPLGDLTAGVAPHPGAQLHGPRLAAQRFLAHRCLTSVKDRRSLPGLRNGPACPRR
ncbi:Hypothetical protein AA314_09307 [Archangium gephyra]|uniref:Uncharacterized protein n=1 Tax=Archangium gephyra TaxID=48 RepID=A0AAC8TK75_9BACT|nr:Hypothetical protein AA314_09307 [Archangium gephyra]